MHNHSFQSPLPPSVGRSKFLRLIGIKVLILVTLITPYFAAAQNPSPPNLGSAANFGLLSGNSITSNKSIYVNGSIGAVSSISLNFSASDTNFYTGNDNPLTSALMYLDSAQGYCTNLSSTLISGNLSGQTLSEGVYTISGAASFSDSSSLTFTGDSSSVFIINISDSLSVMQNAYIHLNGVLARNIFWNIANNLTISDGAKFVGIVISGGNINKTGSLFGAVSFLSLGSIDLIDVDEVVGHNSFSSQLSMVSASNSQVYCFITHPCTQNVVMNGYFESYVTCPDLRANMGNGGQSEVPCDWEDLTGTCDYHNFCSNNPETDVPTNQRHTYLPSLPVTSGTTSQSGQGYVSFVSGMQTKEYFHQILTNDLVQDEWYYGEFYVACSNNSKQGVDNLGMHISQVLTPTNATLGQNFIREILPNNTIVDIIPTINLSTPGIAINPPVNADNPFGWKRVNGLFKASGNERQVTIGRFNGSPLLSINPSGSHSFPTYYFDNVSISKLPSAGPDVTYCPGGPSIQIGETNTCGIPQDLTATYTWSPSTGLSNAYVNNPLASPQGSTIYTLTVTVQGFQSYTSTVTVNVPSLQVNITPASATICIGQSVTLAASGSNNGYVWTHATGNLGWNNTLNITPATTTTYTATSFVSGCFFKNTATVTVNPLPNVQISPICNPDGTTTFSATGAITYTWTGPGIPASPATTGNGYSTSGAVGQTLTYSVTGVSNNCSATVTAFTDPCCRLYEVGPNGYGDPNSADPAVIVPNSPNGTHAIDASAFGGSVTFEGIYHLTCPLELTGGDFHFNPGTIFYVDAQSNHSASVCSGFDLQQGYNFIRASGEATLHLRATTLQAACDRLWGGVYLENANIVSTAGSVIRDAYIGVASVGVNTTTGACPDDNFNIIELHETYFQDNIYGFWEKDKVNAQPNEAIRDCHFENFGSILPYYPNNASFPLIGVYLERNPGASNTGYTTNFYNNLTFSGNTIYGFAEYGMFGRANDIVIGPENNFYDNSRSAIAVNAIKGHFVYIKNNEIDVPFNPTIPTTTRIVGVEAEFNTVVDDNNVITGTGFTTGTTNFTIGVWAQANQLGTLVDNNQFTDLSFGVQYASTVTALTVTKNLFTDNNNAVSYNSPSSSTIVTPHVRCNTIQRVNSTTAMVGIHIGTTTNLANIGGTTTPNGNRFTSITREVHNLGTNTGLRYYQYNSSLEAGNVHFTNTFAPFDNTGMTPPTNGCGGSTGLNRVMGTGPAAIQQMKDSLRLQIGNGDDMRYYLTEIINYHLADSALVPALEAYTDSLPNAHLFAFTSLSLALMDYHRTNGNEAAAQAHKVAVLVNNPADTDLENYCLYFDLTAALGTTGKPNFVPDSADIALLEQVVNSGAGVATNACRLLQFYRHNSGCYAGPDARVTSTSTNQWLGQSYPNPNTGSATIPYILPTAASRASIELRELVTGRLVGTYQLPIKAGEAQLEVNLDRIISGNYVYSLIVDGAGIATGKMVVIK